MILLAPTGKTSCVQQTSPFRYERPIFHAIPNSSARIKEFSLVLATKIDCLSSN